MRKLVFLFATAFITLTSFANNNVDADLENVNTITIQLDDADSSSKIVLDFKTSEELLEFDAATLGGLYAKEAAAVAECTASITVEVSVGVASVSVTVEGVSCSDIVAEIKKLKDQIMNAL